MAKLKQSIAVQRQIPEHVRENYPVFVEFVKLYYEFLEETQSTKLETIRDIDTTLDSFINQFKAEIAKNMPIDLSSDRRLLLKHLREFYLSRGSEASYKFLFRTLFNKEASLFYPSTQILRVSDGKWKQDISIFVELDAATLAGLGDVTEAYINGLAGKFFTIESGGKKIQAYAEQVLRYDLNTFEVFIQRDYASDIIVGATLQYDDVAYKNFGGTVIRCPSKVSIYKAGKGFKVGQLYALKTNIGRGCIIKVTKVDGDGAIKAIQIIRFGLDYQSTFYSYLSSKDEVAFEYVHPVELAIGSPGNPAQAPGYDAGQPAYNEAHGGFIDYGFASRQDYFYYDTDIPVGTPGHRSERFYADASYVGDIVQQFYTDSVGKVIDEDLAIIQVDLGAVAKYPGYYQKADGFVSDEIYLHDGKYYQAFSYVIRVEEELRRYADIIKALVHPAGMKSYAEYNIIKEIEVSATTPLLSQLLQFTDVTLGTDDRGYGYDAWLMEYDELGRIAYVPFPGANKVYSRQGKANIFPTKGIEDNVLHMEEILRSFHRGFPDEFFTLLSSPSNAVSKIAVDSISEYIESMKNEMNKQFRDDILINADSLNFFIERSLSDLIIITEANALFVEKPLQDEISAPTDSYNFGFIKNLLEDIANSDDKYLDSIKVLNDNTELISDLLSNQLQKIIDIDSVSLSETQVTRLEQNMYEAISAIEESLISDAVKSLLDNILALELYANETAKPVNDVLSISDIADVIRAKVFEEQQLVNETSFSIARAAFVDDILDLLLDAYNFAYEKTISEAIILEEQFQLGQYEKSGIEDNVNISDLYSGMISRVCEDIVDSISDALLGHIIGKNIDDPITLLDPSARDLVRGVKQETINISTGGSIRSTPNMYDAEIYFAGNETYQTALATFS